MKGGFLQKLIEKVDRIGPEEVERYMMKLMQEKGFMEKVFDALQEGVVVTDRHGVISYLNSAASDMFVLDRQEVIGDRIDSKIRGLEWKSLVREPNKTVSRDLEVTYPENRFLNFYLAPIEDQTAKGKASLGYVMIIRDITQTRKLEVQKIESETLNVLTMLAAGVAHELGNPLNSLNIHLQVARKKLKKAPPGLREDLEEILEISQGEISRLDLIINQFLEAIRPTTPQLERCDVNQLIQDSLRILQPEIEDRQIEVKLELGEHLNRMQLDPGQIKQAFYNLIRNANQAIGTGGVLRIQSEQDDENLIVRFIDDGAGISAQDMANLFQPFYTTKRKGSGLGLLIVRRIIREHGGEIELESESGEGTCVTCFFPLIERRIRLLESSAKPSPKSEDMDVIDI